MILADILNSYRDRYRVIAEINLDQWYNVPTDIRVSWLHSQLQAVYRTAYDNDERIVFTLTQGEEYDSRECVQGRIARNLAECLRLVDISNFFCVLICTDPTEAAMIQDTMNALSADPVPITIETIPDQCSPSEKRVADQKEIAYGYNSAMPLSIRLDQLTDRERFLLTESRTFCMYPWIHLHTYPTGEAYPCCHAEMTHPVGNCKKQTLAEIWHDQPMQQLRLDMLEERENATCARCYEQEAAGFFSGRRSANKHHGHHIGKLEHTTFEMTYWDIRFSNLCNLSCRSCGHIFSSSWYQDQAALAGPEWRINNEPLNFAGRTETDIWEQLLPHFDHVEQIYFAGGEPLMMEEHYRILDELERRGRFDVRLIYNTNFTQTRLKNRSVFDYWRRFESVAVGASLDAMGPRAEYIRRGTRWDRVVENRREMITTCPNVDFYISPTLSIMNALHLPDFHRSWVDQGLLRPQDLNVNILQDPAHYRIDIATAEFKQQILERYQAHLTWLEPLDLLNRATVGFRSAIEFMLSSDNTHLIDTFWRRTHQLDSVRDEKVLEVLPELAVLT